jgi:hypothetical protein
MADKNYEIEFGGQMIKVPAWASSEQMEDLNSLNKNSLTQLSKLVAIETGALKAVNEMLKAQERLRSQTTRDNDKLIKSLDGVSKDFTDSIKKETDKLKKSQDDDDKKAKKLQQERAAAERDLIRDMQRGLDNIRDSAKNMVQSIGKGDFEGLAAAIGGVVGLGAAAGFAAKTLVNFGKNLSELSGVGAGFGMSLQEIRSIAADAGTGLDGLAKIAQNNSIAFTALGTNANDGLREFARLSREARGIGFTTDEIFADAANAGINVSQIMGDAERGTEEYAARLDQVGQRLYSLSGDIRHTGRSLTQFGLSNEEFNTALAEEIELRRLSGQTEAQIRDQVAGSMRRLYSETTRMADITGVNRREAVRAGVDMAENDPILRRFRTDFQSQYQAYINTFSTGGEVGQDISQAILRGIAGGEGFDVSMALGAINEEALNMFGQIGGLPLLQQIEQFGEQNQDMAQNDPERFQAELNVMTRNGIMQLVDANRETLEALYRSGDSTAGAMLNMADQMRNLPSDVESQMTRLAETANTMGVNAEATAIDAGRSIEQLTNDAKAAMTNDILTAMGVDVNDTGGDLVQVMDGLSNEFKELGFLGAISNKLGEANWYLKAILAALAVGALAGPVGGLIRGIGALGRVVGKIPLGGARTVGSVVSSGARATGNAVTSGVRAVTGTAVAAGTTTAATTAARTATSEVAQEGTEAIARRVSAQVAETTASSLGKSFVKKIPLIGLAAGLGLGGWRAMQGDFVGAGAEVASGVAGTVPGIGTAASIAIDAALLARDISNIYSEAGMSDEDALRFSSVDASEQLLNDMTDRITRAEAGENVYWGRDSVGIAEDQSNMQDLLVSEIARLTDIMEQTGELSQREADALARYNDMLSNMDQPTGMEILDQVGIDSGMISQMSETDQDAVTLMANKVDTLAEKLADGNLSETDRGKVMKEYASAINDLKTIEENGITAEAKQQAQRAKDRDVNVQALLAEKALIENMSESIGEEGIPDSSKARINEIDKIISGLDEVARGDLSLPGDAILKMRESTANKLQADKDKLAALEEEYGKATQIGINEKQAKALLSSGIADNEEEANEMAAIYGYEDEEANKKYQETSKAVREGEGQLQRIENDMRYKKARANELAREMGISTEQITQSEDGKTTKYTNQDGYEIKDGGLYVNGQRVPDELLNQTERDRFKAAETSYNSMNRVPVSKTPDANEPPDTDKNDRISEKVIVPGGQKELETLLNETNRLLRKQTDIIEQQ